MAVIVHPPGTPLPADSPLKGASIQFGFKRPSSSSKESPKPNAQGAMSPKEIPKPK